MKESLQANKLNTPRPNHLPSYQAGDSQQSMETCPAGIDALLAGLCLTGEQSADLDKMLIDNTESRALLQEMLRLTQSKAAL